MHTTTHTQTIIITDRTTTTEIGRTHIHLTPDMDEIAACRAVHVAVTEWGEGNGRIFNDLDWHWQPLEMTNE